MRYCDIWFHHDTIPLKDDNIELLPGPNFLYEITFYFTAVSALLFTLCVLEFLYGLYIYVTVDLYWTGLNSVSIVSVRPPLVVGLIDYTVDAVWQLLVKSECCASEQIMPSQNGFYHNKLIISRLFIVTHCALGMPAVIVGSVNTGAYS